MTKVVIAGAGGRMGQALVRCVERAAGLELAGAVECEGHPQLGLDAGVPAGVGDTGIKLCTDLRAALADADVLIDFTFHSVVPGNAAIASQLGKAVVIGTTGLDDVESAGVRDAAGAVPIVWAPNMSLGVNLLFVMVEKAASILGLDYDVEIVETHHKHKKDSPSGTALRLGEKVAEGRRQDLESVVAYGRRGILDERPKGQIGIHAVRAGDVVGDHKVTFAGDGERVEFVHRATSRDAFVMGALRAAQWVVERQAGLYDMKDVLGL